MPPKRKHFRALVSTRACVLSAKECLDWLTCHRRSSDSRTSQTHRHAARIKNVLKDFMRFARITNPEVFRVVTRASDRLAQGPGEEGM